MADVVRAVAWSGFREMVESMGGDPDAILTAAGVDPIEIQSLDRLIPSRKLTDSIRQACLILARPDFGLQWGMQFQFPSPTVLGIAMSNAATPRQALALLARYAPALSSAFSVSLVEDAGNGQSFLRHHYDPAEFVMADAQYEYSLALTHRTLAKLCGERYAPTSVKYQHARLSPAAVYQSTLGVVPEFEAGEIGLGFPSALLDQRRKNHSHELHEVAKAYLKSWDDGAPASYVRRVEVITRSLLESGDCSQKEVAEALGIQERTLQRRLKAEGETFDRIKDRSRKDLARYLLGQAAMPVSQIASILGYMDESTFARSCRRWFDQSPGEARRELAET